MAGNVRHGADSVLVAFRVFHRRRIPIRLAEDVRGLAQPMDLKDTR